MKYYTQLAVSFLLSIVCLTVFSISSVSAVSFTRSVFIQNVTTNQVEMRWVTDTTEALLVKYGVSTSYGNQVSSDTVTGTGGNNNHAKITGLSPNTKYYYQVTTAAGTALTPAGDTTYYFKTAPPTGSSTPFTFAAWGDSGDSSSTQDSVARQVAAKSPDLTFIAGDIAYPYTTSFANNNGLYFNHYKDSMRFSAFYVACGNHESSCSTVMSDHSLPGGGKSGGTDSSYSFDYGNVHFVALNSNGSFAYNPTNPSASDPQVKWAYNDLKGSSQPWKVLYWHHNGWSAGSHSTQSNIVTNLMKLASDTGANVAFWGHSHTYERWPINTGGFTKTQFYTVGNGGKAGSSGCHSLNPACVKGSGSSDGISNAGFLFFQVNGNSMTANFIGSGGKTEDTVTLTTNGSGPTSPQATNTATPTRPAGNTATNTPRPTVTSGTVFKGDANGDGKVDGIDFVIWMNHYNQSVSGASNGDFNNSGKVDGVDYVIWFQSYNDKVLETPTPTEFGNPTDTPRPTNTRTSTPTPTGPTPTQPVGGTNSLTDCTKYPGPKRIFLETQAWWMDTDSIGTAEQLPLKGIGGHAHTATCFPQDQQVSGGTMHFDVRLMIHKGNRAKIEWLDIGLGPDGQSLARVNLPNLTCDGAEDPKKQCEWWIPIDLDTDKVTSGYSELRFRFNVIQPNGERMFASTGWQAWFHGGSGHYRTPPWLEARGWYETTAYLNSRLLSAVPYSPVSGIWNILVEHTPGSGGKPVGTHAVHIDARFNFDDFGKIYNEGNGAFKGTVSIDTRQLTNGPHCVAIRTSSVDVGGGTDTGLLQFPIIVNNPGGTSGNGKGGCQPGT